MKSIPFKSWPETLTRTADGNRRAILHIARAVRWASAIPPKIGVNGPLSGALKSSLGSQTVELL